MLLGEDVYVISWAPQIPLLTPSITKSRFLIVQAYINHALPSYRSRTQQHQEKGSTPSREEEVPARAEEEPATCGILPGQAVSRFFLGGVHSAHLQYLHAAPIYFLKLIFSKF
jgi:hypothetical protein